MAGRHVGGAACARYACRPRARGLQDHALGADELVGQVAARWGSTGICVLPMLSKRKRHVRCHAHAAGTEAWDTWESGVDARTARDRHSRFCEARPLRSSIAARDQAEACAPCGLCGFVGGWIRCLTSCHGNFCEEGRSASGGGCSLALVCLCTGHFGLIVAARHRAV